MALASHALREALDPRALHLILMPTEACNFRCTYCYESFALARMQPAVVAGVLALLERRACELDSLSISWFGGEPLLALDVIEEISTAALAHARAHPRLAYSANVTTNASTLDRRTFERLLALSVRQFHVALDGPRALHDRRRKRADGGATFDRIWSHLLAARDVPGDFEIVLRVHVDRGNLGSLPELVEQCRAAFGGDARFTLYFKPLSRYGGPNDAQIEVLSDEERALVMPRLEALVRGTQSAAAPLRASDGPHAADDACYAAKANSFVVRADGRLSKCTVALDRPENDVGRLNADGTLALDRSRQRAWLRGLASGDARELFCPMLGLVPLFESTLDERSARQGVSGALAAGA